MTAQPTRLFGGIAHGARADDAGLASSNCPFDWQASNPYAGFLEYNRAPLGQCFLDIAEIGEQ